MNFYAVLGIPVNADEEAIRGAYRILARRWHPDAGAGSSGEEFRRIAEAYATLSDPVRRRVYDLSLPPVRPSAEDIRPESPDVFGRLTHRTGGATPWPAFNTETFAADSLLDELMRLFEDDFPRRS
jgi:curved DNA-binding protein CbpA